MLRTRTGVACVVLAYIPGLLQSQTWQVTLSKDAAGVITMTGLVAGTNVVTESAVTIAVTCQRVDCTGIKGHVIFADSSPASPTALTNSGATTTAVTITLPRIVAIASGAKRFLALKAEGTDLPHFELTAGTSTAPVLTVPLASLLTAKCSAPKTGQPYDPKGDRANFLVTPLGEVLERPGDVIDEDDAIVVTVSGAEQLLPRLMLRRSSEFRVTGGIRIIGSEIRIAELPGLRRQAAGQPPACDVRTVELHDFAPGRGEVEISLRTDDGEESLAKVEFGVNPLYTGAFSFGIVRSALLDTRYGLAFNGTDSIITETEDPSRNADHPAATDNRGRRQRVLYGVFYSHFFGRRDVEKDGLLFRPTIGFALNGISDNVFVGASLIVHGTFTFMGGAHLGRVTRLDPQSGLSIGSTFAGPSAQIPTVRRWQTDVFIGVSLDVRAAAQLLKTAFSTAGGA